MNYRHAYHAGNVPDVFKHVTLCATLARMVEKPAPYCVVETHAGAGVYRLDTGGEWEKGIGRFWHDRGQWTAFRDYFSVIESCNRGSRFLFYPGSPLFIQRFLRARDVAVLCELEPGEFAALRENVGQSKGIAVHHADGWDTGLAALPPHEKRGLVLVDPPYEQPADFRRAADFLARALKRFRNGVYLLWYPIKSPLAVARLHSAVSELAKESGVTACALELLTLPEDVQNRLNGSGIVMINPPWKLAETLRTELEPLAQALAGPSGLPAARVRDLRSGAPQRGKR
jgi:23S rRNA (adenine2030-N6)-methyltransferase